MCVGIRGTRGWVETNNEKSSIALLSGSVESTFTMQDNTESVTVDAMEVLTVKQNEDGVSYDVRPLEEIPEFVQDELSAMPVTLDEILEVMEEYELTENKLSTGRDSWNEGIFQDVLGSSSLSVLVPRGSYENAIPGGMAVDFNGLNLSTLNFFIGARMMEVPDGEPQAAGKFQIWLTERVDILDVMWQEMYIARSDAQQDDLGRIPVVQASLTMKIKDPENGREVSTETMRKLFQTEYDMIRSQLE